MVEHVLDSLPQDVSPRLVATTRSLAGQFEKKIGERSYVYGMWDRTRGQADTIRLLLEQIGYAPTQGGVLVVNVDNILPTQSLASLRLTADMVSASCSIMVHQSTDRSCSYVDNVLNPRVFLEKPDRPPSEFAMSGAWWFRSGNLLLEALEKLDRVCPEGEVYLSQALQYLPGRKVCVPVAPAEVVDWGTPEKLAASGARLVD